MKLLLIEDSHEISTALSRALFTDYCVDLAFNGRDGIGKTEIDNYDVIILDLNLPDMNGLEVCHILRKHNIKSPILILTGESKILSKISLLDAGADDYLTKPFSLGELKVRLRALIRRSGKRELSNNRIVVDDLELDVAEHLVSREGQLIELRRKEFALLECLMQNAGDVVTRENLCRYAWNANDDPWRGTVDVHIKYLRDKIDRPFPKRMIKTVHGLGYKLELASVGAVRECA